MICDLRCRSADVNHRHNRLRDVIFDFCVKAQLAPLKEPPNLIPDKMDRPADIAIPEYRDGPKLLALDVAVTDSLRDDYVKVVSRDPSFSACEDYASTVKVPRYYADLQKLGNLIFKPIVAEALGGWNANATSFFNYIVECLVKRTHDAVFSIVLNHFYQKIGVYLQRYNAKMLLARSQMSYYGF